MIALLLQRQTEVGRSYCWLGCRFWDVGFQEVPGESLEKLSVRYGDAYHETLDPESASVSGPDAR
jgi:hypothetical protein